MKKQIELPRSLTLVGTTHFPPIDNQGAIGSCASQAVNRNQFSNAVSRYLRVFGNDPSFSARDSIDERFSPKFSYNLSGAGTAWVYEFLMDHGSLFQGEVNFHKNPETNGSLKADEKGNLYTGSTSWPVAPGQMERALYYRLTGFEQIWFTHAPYFERLTTCKEGLELIDKIKRSLLDGNVVVTGGYPGRWVFTKIDGLGDLGKKGEEAVVAAAGNGGGGHQVTIVGYDDDLTATFAGVKLRGAFLVANSYGVTWKNGGYCWMMYDSVNTVSEYPALNDDRLYSGPMYVTPRAGICMFPESLTRENQIFTFEEKGTYTLGGKVYPAYTARDGKSGEYLTYSEEGSERSLSLCKEEGRRFAFIPYEEMMALPTSDAKWFKEEYKGSYWIYAADKETGEEGFRVIDAGTGFASSGRKVGIASHNAGRYPEAKSFLLDCQPSKNFTSRLAIAAGKGGASKRVWTLDQFCFTDWKKDVTVGMPALYAKVRVRATDRDCFTLTLTRREKGSAFVKKYMPALFRYASDHPAYCDKKKGEYLNFEGVKKGPEVEGEFALSYHPLLKLPKGKTADDYEWGVELRKGRKGRCALVGGVLIGENGQILAENAANGKKLTFSI